jgi:hypothetical protein
VRVKLDWRDPRPAISGLRSLLSAAEDAPEVAIAGLRGHSGLTWCGPRRVKRRQRVCWMWTYCLPAGADRARGARLGGRRPRGSYRWQALGAAATSVKPPTEWRSTVGWSFAVQKVFERLPTPPKLILRKHDIQQFGLLDHEAWSTQ